MRWSMSPKSMANAASFFGSIFGAGVTPSPFSSSLSRRNGLGRFLFNTTRLIDHRGLRLSAADWLNPCLLMPVSLEPRKYRYFPLASKHGSVASVKPSVIATDAFVSSEYAHTR